MKAVPKPNILNEYLYYLLKQKAVFTYVERLSPRTGGQTGVDLYALNQYPVLLPDLPYQQRVVDVLKSLDDKIELNKRINAELEAMAKTLYDYWFVQFDFPAADGKPYKTSGGKMLWNDELKREFPDGWQVKRLAEMTDVSSESLNPPNAPEKAFKHYSLPNFDETGTYKIEKGAEIRSNKFIVRETDLLVSKLNPWFNRVIFSTDEADLICSTEFVVWRTRNLAFKNYLFMIARDSSFISYCAKSASGTSNSHKRVNPTVMMNYKAVYNENFAGLFGSKIESAVKMRAKNDVENRQLAELRDWLLPLLINGQVKVNEREIETAKHS